ncbi:amidohydrolase family protein [Roseibium sp. SCP14]|uniref:amidohydrolase family protein n=1 Tax=Roseibium sp. SCP14 TaxID=3141375 RepID=UPI003339593A
MQRIDAHIHLWDTAQLDYPWHKRGSFPDLPDTYLLDDAITETGGTDITFVAVQAEMDHSKDPVEETAWIQTIADEHQNGERIEGFVAYADLCQPDLPNVLERHARHPVFRGVRQEIWWQKSSPRPDILEEDLLSNSAWREGFGALASIDAAFDLTCWHTQLRPFSEFLSHHPAIPVIVDHLGSPIAGDDAALGVWLDGIRALADLPNTFMKISGLSQADARWTVESMRPLVDQVLEVFGPERCMLGSNFPIEKLTSTYETVWAAYKALLRDLTLEERDAVYFSTAKEAYRLER